MQAKAQHLPTAVALENIEEMRLQAGIEDLALRTQVRRLGVGDFVKITLLIGDRPLARETLLVRITAIHGASFNGELAGTPASTGLGKLRAGSPIAFTRDHIHSAGQAADGHGVVMTDDGAPPQLVGRVAPPRLTSPLIKTSIKGSPMSASKKAVLSPPRQGIPPALHLRADTTAERLQQIAVLGERINGYVQFIGQIDKLTGTSGEAKAAAVDAFHRRMVALEHHLAKIQEELQLG